MTRDDSITVGSPATAPWARLLDRHRETWASRLVAGSEVVDLAAVDDPVAALTEAPEGTAFVWLGGYAEAGDRDRLRTALEVAGRRRTPLVIGFEADREGDGQRAAQELLTAIDGARLVTQELAAGSVIAAAGDDSTVRRRAVQVLVYANVDAGESSSLVEVEAEPLMTGYVAWLEQANRELRKANARLGRSHLGHHDAAAAAVTARRTDLELRVAELEQQLDEQRAVAAASHQAFLEAQWDKESTLQAPRYRIVDSLRELAVNLPGVSSLVQLRSRRVSKRWEPPS